MGVLALLKISFGLSPHKMLLVTVGLLLFMLYMPPPMLAELPLNVQLVTVGLLLVWLVIAPPLLVA